VGEPTTADVWAGDTMNTVFHQSEKEGISPEDNNNDKEGEKVKSVHFDLKGRGVSGKPQEQTLDYRTSDLCEAGPFRLKMESTVMEVGANAESPPTYVKYMYIHPVCPKNERAVVGLNLDDRSTCTDVEYACVHPSVKPVVRVRDTDDIGSKDTNALRVSKIHMDVITKDMAAANTYVLVEDTVVLDPLKCPDTLDPLENVIDVKDLDTKSFGASSRWKL
jgi:hypothetical protein